MVGLWGAVIFSCASSCEVLSARGRKGIFGSENTTDGKRCNLQPAVLGDICACGRESDMLSHQFYQLILKSFPHMLDVTKNRD